MARKDSVERLKALKAAKVGMGGPERVARQRGRGKLDARARLELLLDLGSIQELGMLAAAEGRLPEEEDPGRPSAADGVLTAFGTVEGRPVAAAVYDFTVLGGTIGEVGERKVSRLRDLALKARTPLVWLVDSGGARLEAGGEVDPRRLAGFADTGYLFREQSVLSGVVPQVAAMLGPGAAGTAYIPGLADYVPMVAGVGSIAVGGPTLVESTVGEQVTERQLGAAAPTTGVRRGRRSSPTTRPASPRCEPTSATPSLEKPPQPQGGDPADRREESLPPRCRQPAPGLDSEGHHRPGRQGRSSGEAALHRNLLTGLCRIDSWSMGIVASNSMHLGGAGRRRLRQKGRPLRRALRCLRHPLLFLRTCRASWWGPRPSNRGWSGTGRG
jgi:acetyl-CoA carboxylase carboxyltransferase component